ncbi:2067_t:CDS:1, partial [Funneliformis geosporum]
VKAFFFKLYNPNSSTSSQLDLNLSSTIPNLKLEYYKLTSTKYYKKMYDKMLHLIGIQN